MNDEPEIPHDGIKRLRRDRGYVTQAYTTGFERLRVGRLTYEYELDVAEFPFDRDFEVEWVDGPVRFVLERDDTSDYYKLWAYPAGKAERWTQESDYSGSHGSGGGSRPYESVLINAPWDYSHGEPRDEYDGETTAQATFSVNLLANPFMLEYHSRDDVADEATFLSVGGILEVATQHNTKAMRKGKYPLSWRQVASQARIVLADAVKKPFYELYKNGPRLTLHHYWEQDRRVQRKRSEARKLLSKWKWKAGLAEKPQWVAEKEYWEQQEHPQRQQSPPPDRGAPQEPDEEDNICPECQARLHKKDLLTESFEEGGTYSVRGTKYLCPDCGAEVGVDANYEGPVPVETPQGTELH